MILPTYNLKNGRLGEAVVVLRYTSLLHSLLSIPLFHVVAMFSKSIGVCRKGCLLYHNLFYG